MTPSNDERIFIFWSKSTGRYASLSSLLADGGWQVVVAANSSSLTQFNEEADNRRVCLAILNPEGKFSSEDVQAVGEFLAQGRHSAIIGGAASDQERPRRSNLNALVAPFGVRFNEDRVIRPNPYALYHPTEAVLEDFVANRAIGDSMRKFASAAAAAAAERSANSVNDRLLADIVQPSERAPPGPRIVYPRGCTLEVASRAATVMLTSSKWALPSGQPICVFHAPDKAARVVMLGSAALLSDKHINLEDNKALACSLLDSLTNADFHINVSDARTLEIGPSNMTADLDKLLNTPIACLQALEPLPENRLALMDKSLFRIDTSKLPQVLAAYEELRVLNGPLTLMRPTISWRDHQQQQQAPGRTREVRLEELKFLLKRSDGRLALL